MAVFWALSKYFLGKDGSALWKKLAAYADVEPGRIFYPRPDPAQSLSVLKQYLDKKQ